VWRRAVKASGITPPPRFHDLRHTSVAILIEQGAHPKLIQSRVGHGSITMTMDTYGHLFPTADEVLAQGLEEYKPTEGGGEVVSL
jgi:integrase